MRLSGGGVGRWRLREHWVRAEWRPGKENDLGGAPRARVGVEVVRPDKRRNQISGQEWGSGAWGPFSSGQQESRTEGPTPNQHHPQKAP